jgi:eukaryotic-like serine/threonine-protein kinase
VTPERYQEVGRLYRAALELEPSQRAAYLAQECGGDKALIKDVESLLAYDARSEGLIDRPAMEAAALAMAEDAADKPTLSITSQNIGHFSIISLLGTGGMGEVWLAEDSQLRRKVALKILPAEFTADVGRMRRFAQEARSASSLNHPNIITVHEIGEAGKTHYIVTEYVEGETLRQRLTAAPGNRLAPAAALDLAVQIAAALSAAHEAGIVHRDIKPENAMVRRDGIVKVLDFGLAKLTKTAAVEGSPSSMSSRDSTEAGIIMGTPRYMSPEQARGENVDARSDIFSLGVMLYEMTTGRPPFDGATISELIAAILRDSPPPFVASVPDTDAELERIVDRALRKDRAERYQTARELLTDLNKLKEKLLLEKFGVSPVARRSDPVSHARVTKTNKRRLAVLIVGIVLLVAAGAWSYFDRSDPTPPRTDTVLLADFSNQTGDEIFDSTLKQGLAIQLEQSRSLNVFPEARVRQTLRQMERPTDTRVTPEVAQEICERQNLKAFIAGSIAPLGSHYVITLTALRGNNGEELARTQTTATTKEQVLRALEDAVAKLDERLGGGLSSIQQSNQPLAQAMTSNLQALKAFSASWELTATGRFVEALPLARRAAELDPQFSLAWDQLAIICGATEQPEAAAEYQARLVQLQEERAAQSKYPVSEDYKLDIDTWYQRLTTGNLNKLLEIAMLRRQISPRSPFVLMDLGASYVLVGQSEQALPLLGEVIGIVKNVAPPYKMLAQALIRLNRFSAAEDTITQAMQLKLDMTAYHTQLYQIAFVNGNSARMQQQFDGMQHKADEYVAFDWEAAAAGFKGEWQKAREFSSRAIDLAVSVGNREVAARYATEQGLRSALFEDNRLAKASVAQGLTLNRGRLPLSRAALTLALCGENTQAQALLDELTKRYREDTVVNSIWVPLTQATISLNRGDVAQAIKQLESTSRYVVVAELWPQYLRGQAYLKRKQGVEAAREFQDILDHRGYAPLSPLYPLAQLGLSRALSLTGDVAQSQKARQDFLSAWQKADPDLPILRVGEASSGARKLHEIKH